jgi:hypothetical protein
MRAHPRYLGWGIAWRGWAILRGASALALAGLLLAGPGAFVPAQVPPNPPAPGGAGAARFIVMDVMVDAGATPLAAYQLEISATNAAVKIVGIEGGEPAAFRLPPYYDPLAMQGDRVVLGAFSTADPDQLPHGAVRVASLHCLISDGQPPSFHSAVTAAAASDGQPLTARVQLHQRNTP